MFEQTFLNTPTNTRKPYSILLSSLLQIAALALLCLVPLVFTQVMPTLQLKSVMAAPPKPPPLLKKLAASTPHPTPTTRRYFQLTQIVPLPKFTSATTAAPEVTAPSVDAAGGDTNGVPGGLAYDVPGAPPPQPPSAPKLKPVPKEPVRIGGTVSAANILRMVQPTYPPLARANRIQGMVEFTAVISKQGTIENLTLVSGHPLLIKSAEQAVLQWRYRPTLLNGEPVEVITDIQVRFNLNQ